MNKRDLTLNISVLSANNVCNNVMCDNTNFIYVTLGWDGFLTRTKKMNKRDFTLSIFVQITFIIM